MPTAPLDTIETIVNAARVRLNDAIQSLGGDVLTDSQPFTLVVVNNAWRVFQRKLAALGYAALEDETIITGIPAIVTNDPSIQVWIDWTGYNNGTTFNSSYVLPQNLIQPMDCWERQATTSDYFADMDDVTGDSIPRIPHQSYQQLWQWRYNRLYMPGSLTDTDLLIKFAAYYPDFTSISATPTQTVPIVQCLDAFSNYICAEVAKSRGDVDGAAFVAAGDAAAAMIAERDGASASGMLKQAERGKMADAYTPGGPQ